MNTCEKFFAKSDGWNRWLEHYHEWWPESNSRGKKKLEYKKSYRHFGRFQDIREILWIKKFGSIEARCISLSWICASPELFIRAFHFICRIAFDCAFERKHITEDEIRLTTRKNTFQMSVCHVLRRYCHCELNRNANWKRERKSSFSPLNSRKWNILFHLNARFYMNAACNNYNI